MRLTIGLDLDDTVAEYLKGLQKFIISQHPDFYNGMSEQEIATHFPPMPAFDSMNWTHLHSDRELFLKYHSEAVEEGLFQNLEEIPNAVKTLRTLRKEFDTLQIYVITSRFVTYGQNARVLSDTGIWLDKVGLPYKDIMFVRDKRDIVTDVYVDDKPETITNLRALNRTAFAYTQSYNKDMPGPHINNWDDGLTKLRATLHKIQEEKKSQ